MDPAGKGNISSEAIFAALRVLTRSPAPLGVADLHRLTGEPTSSVHRAVSTLEETGYAMRHQGAARFIPGPMCSHLVHAVLARFAIARTARPYLSRLVDLSGGVGALNVRLGWYSVRLLSLDGRTDYVEVRRVGQPRLLHEDLGPLTILCFMQKQDIERYAAFCARETGLAAKALDIPGRIRAALRDGFAALRPEPDRPGRAWVGFPVTHPEDGKVFASLSVTVAAVPDNSAFDAALLAEMRETLQLLQRELAADPAKCAAPYRSLDPDTLILPVAAA